MKIAAYNYREFDEGKYFEKFAKEYDADCEGDWMPQFMRHDQNGWVIKDYKF